MYKIVLADDEEMIRNGLADLVDWESLGFLLQSSFRDGEEVMDYVQRHEVDVILTDIEMVKLSGLEVARNIHESYPDIRVILLSGYQQFEYAKLAIQYNVKEYLLKPVRYREIVRVFSQVKQELDKEKMEREERLTNKRHAVELAQWCQQQLYRTITAGMVQEAGKLQEQLRAAHMEAHPEHSPCLLLELQMDGRETINGSGSEVLVERLHEWLKLHMDNVYYLFLHEHVPIRQVLAVGESGLSLEELRRQTDKQLQQLKKSVSSLFGVQVNYRIQLAHQRLADLMSAYKQAEADKGSQQLKAPSLMPVASLIDKARDYMKDHCGEEISLDSVAAHVHLNPVYFSRVFKEYTGENFIVHLTHLRIQKAIELLISQKYKTYEVAEMVGYRDSKYFAKLFRGATGLTPAEFLRKQILNESNEQ